MRPRRLRLPARAAWLVALVGALALGPSAPASAEPRGEDIPGRHEARRARRLDANGQLDPEAVLRARRELDARPRPLRTQDAGAFSWQWLGPGNVGGRVRVLVIHPTNPQWMWIGAAGGGIWRTTNGGANWSPMSDFMPSLAVASMAIDPVNTGTLYAGTGELVGSNSSIPGAGIFKSTDSGETWTQLPGTANANFHYVSRIEHHPALSGRLLAGTRTGLWRSIDGGTSWDTLFVPPDGGAVRDVKYNPANFNIIAVGTEHDLYLSPDAGQTWNRQTSGAVGKMPVSPGDCEIEFARTNTNILFVSAGRDGGDINDLSDIVYRSTDGGATWQACMGTNADRWSNALWVSPTDPNVVIVGGFGDLWRTTEALASGPTLEKISAWQEYPQGLSAHGDQHQVVAHPGYDGLTNRTVYFVNDGGVQMTSDVLAVSQTSGWFNLAHNLGVSQFFGASISRDGTTLVGGMQDMGSARSHFSGDPQAWTPVSGGDGGYAAVVPDDPQRYFVTAQFGWVGRSDNGQPPVAKLAGLYGPEQRNQFDFLAPLVMDPGDPSVLWLGGIVVWRTTNSADLWESVRDSLPNKARCVAIDVSRTDSDVVWIGYHNGLVSHTEDAGLSWTNHSIPGATFITDIAVNPASPAEVIVTMGGTNNNVWITTDNGANWTRRTGVAPNQLPAIQVNTVRYHPLVPNWVYLGTDLGVFASEDKGLNWSVTPAFGTNEGPNNVEVDELFWQGTTYLLAATHGRGVYRSMPVPVVYVDKAHVGFENGSEPYPFNTVQEAVNVYPAGWLIAIRSATYTEPPLVINRRATFRAVGGPVRIE